MEFVHYIFFIKPFWISLEANFIWNIIEEDLCLGTDWLRDYLIWTFVWNLYLGHFIRQKKITIINF